MSLPIFDQAWDAFTRSPARYHQPDETATPEDPVTLPIITAIEDEAHQLGADVSDIWHQVLARHLTVGNMLAHAGQFVQGVEASPVAQALEKFALGPAGEATVARIIADVAGLAEAQGNQAAGANLQAGAEPADAVPAA